MTIYLTKEVSVDTEIDAELELELDEVVDGNEDDILDYLLTSGHRRFVLDSVGDTLLQDGDFVERVKQEHGLLTEEEAKDMFHVEQPETPERGAVLFGSSIIFRTGGEVGILADYFPLHDDRLAVRISSLHGGGYFVADKDTTLRLLSLLPPPPKPLPTP
jgi:hypothetical protein